MQCLSFQCWTHFKCQLGVMSQENSISSLRVHGKAVETVTFVFITSSSVTSASFGIVCVGENLDIHSFGSTYGDKFYNYKFLHVLCLHNNLCVHWNEYNLSYGYCILIFVHKQVTKASEKYDDSLFFKT